AVVAATAPTLAEVQKAGQKPGPITLKDYRLVGDLLALRLRANVQLGNVKEALAVDLPLLRRLAPEDGLNADPTAVLRALVRELDVQVKELRKKGDKAKLQVTVTNFSAFLDELAKDVDLPAKQPEKAELFRQTLMFLGNSYSSLSQHDRAAKLYGRVPEPAKGADEKDWQLYGFLRLLQAQQLRQAKQYAEATRVLTELTAHPKARMSLLGEKEQIHVLEDQGVYGTAITRWGKFMDLPQIKKRLAVDNKAKDLYFDCFYHYIYCNYMYGKNHKDPKKTADYVKRAAGYVLALERSKNRDGWDRIGARLQELLQAEPALQQAHDELKKAAK